MSYLLCCFGRDGKEVRRQILNTWRKRTKVKSLYKNLGVVKGGCVWGQTTGSSSRPSRPDVVRSEQLGHIPFGSFGRDQGGSAPRYRSFTAAYGMVKRAWLDLGLKQRSSDPWPADPGWMPLEHCRASSQWTGKRRLPLWCLCWSKVQSS